MIFNEDVEALEQEEGHLSSWSGSGSSWLLLWLCLDGLSIDMVPTDTICPVAQHE